MSVHASTEGCKKDGESDRETAYVSAYFGGRLTESYSCTKCFPYIWQQGYFG